MRGHYVAGACLLVFAMSCAGSGDKIPRSASSSRSPTPVAVSRRGSSSVPSDAAPSSRHAISSVGPVQIVSPRFAVAAFTQCRVQPWGCDGQLRSTVDLGRHWRDITPPTCSSGIGITDVNFVDAMHGWVIGYSCNAPARSAIWRTADGGITWSKVGAPPTSCQNGTGHYLDLLTATTGWMASWTRNGATELSSVAGGTPWTSGSPLPSEGNINFVNANLGFLVGFPESPTLYRTTDAGVMWHPIAPPRSGGRWRVMSLPTFFARNRGVEPIDLIRHGHEQLAFDTTANGGRTWSLSAVLRPRGSDPRGLSAQVSVSTPTTWWASIGKPASVYVTRDAGHTWHRSTRPFPGSAALYALGGRRAWLVSSHLNASRLYLTTNGGHSWRRLHRLRRS